MPTTTINLTGQALSKVDDTNVTLLLGGTPLTALLKATSIAVGWTGQLAPSRGGTGLGSLGTANQLLRVNAGATALEYFTPSFGTGTVTTASVVSANGFTGTVANQTTTPAITLTTSITGVLIGNGTALTTNSNFAYDGATNSFTAGLATTGAINIDGTTTDVSIGYINGNTESAALVNSTGAVLYFTSDAGVNSYGFKGSATGTQIYVGSTIYTLPVDGSANQVLKTNGSGTLSWTTPAAGTVTSVTGSGNIASSGGATPNITFTGVLPTANGGTAVNIATQILTTGAGITNESGAAVSRIRLSANNNIGKILSWATTGLARWAIRVDGNETGANAGGDIALRRYDDAGTFIDNVWSAVRSTGAFTFEKPFYGTSSLTLGTASTTAGQLTLQNATNAFTQTIRGTNPAASIIYDLPTTAPTLGQVLSATAPAAGIVTLSWATASSGITAGTTTVTSGTSGDVLMNISSVVGSATATVNRAYRLDVGTPFNSFFNFGAGQAVGYNNTTALRNTSMGYNALSALTTGDDNTAIGANAGLVLSTQNYCTYIGSGVAAGHTGSNNTAIGQQAMENGSGSYNTAIGYLSQGIGNGNGGSNTSIGDSSLRLKSSGIGNVALGYYSLYNLTTGSYNTALGNQACLFGNLSSTIGIGFAAIPTANYQGVLGSYDPDGRIDNWFLNGVTSTAPYSTVINGCGGSGTNIAGASLTIAGGKGTGTGAGGNIIFQTSTVGSSGTTLQTLATRFTIEKLRVTAAVPIKLMGYTVATLPAAPSVGDTAYCTDLLAPTFFTVAVGGGAVTGMVFYDGTIWKT